MGFSATAFQAFGAGVSAYGAYSGAKSQKAALEGQAQIAEWQAKQALAKGRIDENTVQMHTASVFSDQRAQLAANGVDLGTGSASDILATTKLMGAVDALTVRDNAAREAWGLETQSDMLRKSATQVKPGMATATSLVDSAGKVAQSWYTWQKAGGEMPTWWTGDKQPSLRNYGRGDR